MSASTRMHDVFREGARSRREGTPCKYPGNSLLGQIATYGWVQEDLRLALMKYDEKYRESQLHAERAYPEIFPSSEGCWK